MSCVPLFDIYSFNNITRAGIRIKLFYWFSDRWVWPRLGSEKTMGFILSQFWRQLQMESREMVRPGASAEPTSTLVYWPYSLTGTFRSKHLGAISWGKTRTFLQHVILSSQPYESTWEMKSKLRAVIRLQNTGLLLGNSSATLQGYFAEAKPHKPSPVLL